MTNPFPVVIFHNPACGTSRNTLAIVRASGETPTVIDYMTVGWTRAQLRGLLAEMQATPRDILRDKEALAADLGLREPDATDDAILGAMAAHPVLVNRPIVRTPLGTRLCRPSEQVFALLRCPPESFVKEDGDRVEPGAEAQPK